MRAVYHINMAWQSPQKVLVSAPPGVTLVRRSDKSSPRTYLAAVMPTDAGIHDAYNSCTVSLTYHGAYSTIAIVSQRPTS